MTLRGGRERGRENGICDAVTIIWTGDPRFVQIGRRCRINVELFPFLSSARFWLSFFFRCLLFPASLSTGKGLSRC